MAYDQNSGYVPASFSTLMSQVRLNINAQFGTTYTAETFVGTNFYKYFYALIQELQKNEVKTSEIFLKLQDYFKVTNERISRPVVTNPGLVEKFLAEGFVASVKKPISDDAGKVFICVDTDDTADDYAQTKLKIAEIIRDSVVAGVVSQGAESETITLSNGQSFDFKFDLPNRVETWLRLTLAVSDNNQFVIQGPDWVRDRLLANIAERYRLGLNFEPQKYFSVIDAPWAGEITLEYSFDDDTWNEGIYVTDYDELLYFPLANVTIVED